MFTLVRVEQIITGWMAELRFERPLCEPPFVHPNKMVNGIPSLPEATSTLTGSEGAVVPYTLGETSCRAVGSHSPKRIYKGFPKTELSWPNFDAAT